MTSGEQDAATPATVYEKSGFGIKIGGAQFYLQPFRLDEKLFRVEEQCFHVQSIHFVKVSLNGTLALR